MGAPSKLDEFLLSPQVRMCSRTVPGSSRNKDVENREPTGNRSQTEPYPKVELSVRPASNTADSDQGDTSHMVTRFQEKILFCSLGTSSGKQQKARFTSEPQFGSENTPTTIETDQTLLASQQLANNSNSANFNNNINRNSKQPKLLTSTMPTLTESHRSLNCLKIYSKRFPKIHNQLTEEEKVNYFPSLMRGDALQTINYVTSPNGVNLGEILTVFHGKYLKIQSIATAKHKVQRPIINSRNQKFFDFLDEHQKLAKHAF